MKLIIDIPDDIYNKKVLQAPKPPNNTYIEWYVLHGKPYEETQGDLVSREALKKAIEQYQIQWNKNCDIDIAKWNCCGTILAIIDNAPTVHHPNCDTCEDKAKQYTLGFQDGYLTGKERPKGEWIDDKEYPYLANCSNCGYQMNTHEEHGYFKFCPNCGAGCKMCN